MFPNRFDIFLGRTLGCVLVIVVSLLVPDLIYSGFDCTQPPAPGKSSFLFRGTLRMTTNGPDLFQCGEKDSPTPSTCELFNRVYTDFESACVNSEIGFSGDYFPHAFPTFNFAYESDSFQLAYGP